MDKVIILLNNEEVEIPKSDLDWFVKEKGAKQKTTSAKAKKEKEETEN